MGGSFGGPDLRLVKDGPREPTFREKTWNVAINSIAFLCAVPALLIDLAIMLPLGFMIGMITNRFPEWAKVPLTPLILDRLPSIEHKECPERFSSRPFYRKRQN